MALFVVRHQHEPDRCPALDAEAGAGLLNYLSRPNVKQHGITIKGEAVVQDEHTFFLIAEASDEAQLRRFMRPFAEAGSLDVFPASTCAMVVASGGVWRRPTRCRRPRRGGPGRSLPVRRRFERWSAVS
jgi:hypothetical protein